MHAQLRPFEHFTGNAGDIWMLRVRTEYYSSVTNSRAFTSSSRKGLDAQQAEFAVKKFRSHRKVGTGICDSRRTGYFLWD